MTHPSFNEEIELWNRGYDIVVGLDEVGRGAFAGPVTVGAVVFPKNCTDFLQEKDFREINDSKLLTPKKRTKLVETITSRALVYSINSVDLPVINRHGIGKATNRAFRKAVGSIIYQVSSNISDEKVHNRSIHNTCYILIDGFKIKYLRGFGKNKQKGIINGDKKSYTIAAASILAKTHRDSIMVELSKKYPKYKFDIHKGYGTKLHQELIIKYGFSKLHRTSFNLAYLRQEK